jgi:hypothetical protein
MNKSATDEKESTRVTPEGLRPRLAASDSEILSARLLIERGLRTGDRHKQHVWELARRPLKGDALLYEPKVWFPYDKYENTGLKVKERSLAHEWYLSERPDKAADVEPEAPPLSKRSRWTRWLRG